MDSARRAVLPLVAGLVAVAALGVWWVQPVASEFRGWVTFAAIFAVTWPVIGFAGGIRQGFWALSLVLDAAKQWRGRVGASWIGWWGAVVGVAWIPRVAWVLVCALAGAVAAGVVAPGVLGRFRIRLGLARYLEGFGERLEVRRRWEADAMEVITGRPLADLPEAKRPPFPRLLRRGVRVTKAVRTVMVEPPSSWDRDDVAKFAGHLTGHWSGFAPTVRPFTRKRGKKRCYEIAVYMDPLPRTVPWPARRPAGPGVPFGTGLGGRVERVVLTFGGHPAHILVAGSTGNGKTTLVRGWMFGWVEDGLDVWVLDPKDEGDLDGISPNPTAATTVEITEALERWEAERVARKEAIKRGERPRETVLVIDELIDVLNPPDGASKEIKELIGRGRAAYYALIRKGRSAGIHVVSCTQEPSAEMMGGSGMLRRNHHGRVLVGKAEAEIVQMMFKGKTLSADDIGALVEAGPGRALVSDLSASGQRDVVPCQVWFREAPARPDPVEAPPADPSLFDADVVDAVEVVDGEVVEGLPTGSSPLVSDAPVEDDLAARVLELLRSDGSTARADLARAFGMKPDDNRIRKAVAALVEAGLVTTEQSGRRRSTVVTPVAAVAV